MDMTWFAAGYQDIIEDKFFDVGRLIRCEADYAEYRRGARVAIAFKRALGV
jgi:hypothetical protein